MCGLKYKLIFSFLVVVPVSLSAMEAGEALSSGSQENPYPDQDKAWYQTSRDEGQRTFVVAATQGTMLLIRQPHGRAREGGPKRELKIKELPKE